MEFKDIIRGLNHLGCPLFYGILGNNYHLELDKYIPKTQRELVHFLECNRQLWGPRHRDKFSPHVDKYGHPVYIVIEKELFEKELCDLKRNVLTYKTRTPTGLQVYQNPLGELFYEKRNGLLAPRKPRAEA